MPAAMSPINQLITWPLTKAASRIMSLEKNPAKRGKPEIASAAIRKVQRGDRHVPAQAAHLEDVQLAVRARA